jgi:acyl dehydratase
MPDPSHVGRRYEAKGHVVDAERTKQFATAVAGEAAVFAPGSVPPTYAAVYCLGPSMAQVFMDAELGINLAGLIHGEQSFEWPAPLQPGDVVDASAEIVAVEEKRGLTFVTVALEAKNQTGTTVCRGRSLLLMRGAGG